MKKIALRAIILILTFNVLSFEIFGQITRIRFARGRTSASVSGTVGGYSERAYVLDARYGQYLSANVNSSGGRVKFNNGATSTGYSTDTGNNYLYLNNGCGRQASFTLTVSISQ